MTILDQNVENLIQTIIQDRYKLPPAELLESLSSSIEAIVEQFENAEKNGFPIRGDLRKLLIRTAVEKALR